MGQSELGFGMNSVVEERDKNERRELAGRLFVINVVTERIHGFRVTSCPYLPRTVRFPKMWDSPRQMGIADLPKASPKTRGKD